MTSLGVLTVLVVALLLLTASFFSLGQVQEHEPDPNVKDESTAVPIITAELEARQSPYCPGRFDSDTCMTSLPIVFPIDEANYHYLVAWRIENNIWFKVNSIDDARMLSLEHLHTLMSPEFMLRVSHAFQHLNSSRSVVKEQHAFACNYYRCARQISFPLGHDLHYLQFIQLYNGEILWNSLPSVLSFEDWGKLSQNGTYEALNDTILSIREIPIRDPVDLSEVKK